MTMSAETLISVEEYLNTSYDPDVEYVDGVLVERSVGDWLHSLTQRNIIIALGRYPGVYGVLELRSPDEVHPVSSAGCLRPPRPSPIPLPGGRRFPGDRDPVGRRSNDQGDGEVGRVRPKR